MEEDEQHRMVGQVGVTEIEKYLQCVYASLISLWWFDFKLEPILVTS